MTSENILEKFQKVLTEIDCNGITLSIENIYFPSNTIRGNWLGTKSLIPIHELRIEDKRIHKIYAHGMNPEVFRHTKKLILSKLYIDSLENNNFVHMISLEFLKLESLPLKQIHLSVFAVNKHLREILFEDHPSYQISVDGAEEMFPMESLQTLTFFEMNLRQTIMRKSFRGLPALKNLYLTKNNIMYIPADAFDEIMESIERIDLTENDMITLSGAVFERVVQHKNINKMLLESNPFHCDELILELKYLILEHSKKFDLPTCRSPVRLEGKYVHQANIEGTVSPSSTVAPTTVSTPSSTYEPTSTSSPIRPSEALGIHCKVQNSKIKLFIILKGEWGMKIRRDQDGNAKMFLKKFPYDWNIFWLQSHKKVNESADLRYGCFTNKRTNEKYNITINKTIEYDKFYLVCLVNMLQKDTRPMNCISFNLRDLLVDIDSVWISKQHQIVLIIIFVTIGIACALIGVFCARFPYRWISICMKSFSSKSAISKKK